MPCNLSKGVAHAQRIEDISIALSNAGEEKVREILTVTDDEINEAKALLEEKRTCHESMD